MLNYGETSFWDSGRFTAKLAGLEDDATEAGRTG
jgi:hypothetical protein